MTNQWLKRHGWLDYEIHLKTYEQHAPEKCKMDIITLDSPFCYVDWDKTKFYCTDAFDCVISKTDKAKDEDVSKLINQLLNSEYIDSVEIIGDLIVCEPTEGIEANNNLHPKPRVHEKRIGWHSKYACYGSTDTPWEVNEPKDIYDMMKVFIDKEEVKEDEPEDELVIENDLAELGYI